MNERDSMTRNLWSIILFCLLVSSVFAKPASPITVSRPRGKRPQRRQPKPAPKFIVIDKTVKPLKVKMVLVPKGPFWCGSNWADAMVGPRHKRELPAYYIDVHEVTNKQWARFVDAHGITPPDYWMNDKQPDNFMSLPVVNVSWYEAQAFAKWAGKRLPTEFEWEKAARGPNGNIFPWGHLYEKDLANTFLTEKYQPTPVGSFPEGKSPYGCHDMLGNALEWTASSFSLYPKTRFLPQKIVPNLRILRGVSWRYEPRPLFNRYPAPAHWQRWNHDRYRPRKGKPATMGVIGFRCAKDVPKDI